MWNFSCNCWVPKPSHTELKGNTGRTVMFSSVGTTVGLFTTGSHSLLCGSNAKRWEPRLAPGALCWSKGCLLSQQFSCQPPLTPQKKLHRLKYFGNGPGLFRQVNMFFRYGFSVPVFCPCLFHFAAYWSWELPLQRCWNILEFKHLIFHGVGKILVLIVFMLDGILRLGSS